MPEKTEKILFIGSKSSGLELLKVLNKNASDSEGMISLSAMTFDDSTDIRSKLYEFRIYASENNIPLTIANNRKQADEFIKAISPDICFVMGWYWIFSEKILDSVPNGFIGVHYSLLPKNRGFSPLVWSVINGEEETGFSVFSMNAEMDEGDIWLQKKITIDKDEYIGKILEKFETEVVKSFSELLPKILSGEVKPKPQEKDGATYLKKRESKDGRINWNRTSEEIYNFIRAQSEPYPGAFTLSENIKLIIAKASPSSNIEGRLSGEIIESGIEGIRVACGNSTSIIINEIEINGEIIKANKFITSENSKLI